MKQIPREGQVGDLQLYPLWSAFTLASAVCPLPPKPATAPVTSVAHQLNLSVVVKFFTSS